MDDISTILVPGSDVDMADMRDWLIDLEKRSGTWAFGALSAGTTSGVARDFSFTGHSGGTTDFRAVVDKLTAGGSQSIDQAVVRNTQLEITISSGKTLTRAFGQQAYVRLGLSGSTTGNVTSIRVFDGHIANEGSGTITNAAVYFADGVDLNDGTGLINHMIGFASGDMGHATRVANSAIGFSAGDITAGAPLTAGFRSQVTSGTNKFAFYAEGTAPSVFTSRVGIGSSTSPTDVFEVFNGYAKMSSTTTFAGAGQYHEMRTSNSTYVAFFTNTHATTPEGIRIRFTAATPNNTSRRFIYFDDPGGDRLIGWSNGNLVNANNSYGAISDRKFKTDIKDARPQLADIRKLRFRNYKLKSDPRFEQIGLVAQEVQKISPGLVSKAGDDNHLELAYSVLNVKAIKALQELADDVDVIRHDVQLLKAA